MTWFKVDDSFYDHPKVFDAPDCAVALWTRAGTWSARNLTDGFVPAGMPARLCGDPDTAVKELVRRGLWSRKPGGYQMVDTLLTPMGAEILVCDWRRDDRRAKIPAELRLRVYERDGWACVDCGALDDLTLDHIRAWSRGGVDSEENLRTLCRSCNSKKGAKVL